MTIRLLIVDDHRLTALGTQALLASQGYEVEVVHRVGDVDDALQGPAFDLSLVDMVFSKELQSGIDVIEKILASSPGTRIVLFTAGDDARRHHLATALSRFPVAGGIPKDSLPSTLFDCVRTVLGNGVFFDPEIEAFRPTPDRDPSGELLKTPAHAAIWCALAAGHTSREEIARVTHYSARTVGNAIGPMGAKLRELDLSKQERITLAHLAAYAAHQKAFFDNWQWRQQHPR